MSNPDTIFELIDATDCENYYQLGLFLSLADSIAELEKCADPNDMGSDYPHDDFCRVEVRERKIGWCGHGKLVHTREWELKLDEAKDEWVWIARIREAAK